MVNAGRAVVVVGDIGSTFTKLVAVSSVGDFVASVRVPTSTSDIAAGVERARNRLLGEVGRARRATDLALSSSAGGGLRVAVLGLEPALTLGAGLRTSATAGARVVATYAAGDLAGQTRASFQASAPDLALLTGGTNGGDTVALLDHAESLRRLAARLPVVVAGNEDAQQRVGEILGPHRLVRFAGNVMPRVGELRGEPAQREIRDLFVQHVMGRGRFSSASPIAAAVRMPTPTAVLRAADALSSAPGSAILRRPVVVDVGGATTDVHSVIPVDSAGRGYANSGLGYQRLTRTVEGDLGLRENAPSLIDAALSLGYASAEIAPLAAGARRRGLERDFLPDDPEECEIDERLAGVAATIALHRHAGALRTALTSDGAVLRKDGRDLREASCVIATGGVFAHSPRAREIVADALRTVRTRGGLVPSDVPILIDRSYLLWAVGLLSAELRRPRAASWPVRCGSPLGDDV